MSQDRFDQLTAHFLGLSWKVCEDRHVVSGTLYPFEFHSPREVAIATFANDWHNLTCNGGLIYPNYKSRVFKEVTQEVDTVVPRGYTFEMHVFSNGRHPLFYSVDPIINPLRCKGLPHLYLHSPIEVLPGITTVPLCVYPPHDTDWKPLTDSFDKPLAWLSHWFARFAIWQKTNIWFGHISSHDPTYIAKHFSRGLCWCGLPNSMNECRHV